MGTEKTFDTRQLFDAAFRVYFWMVDKTTWVTQAEITANTGVSGRMMRRICQAMPKGYISSGQGYKIANTASRADVKQCVKSLTHRAELMLHRAQELTDYLS